MPSDLTTALRAARDAHRPIVVPYLMVDRARRRTFPALVEGLGAAGASALELGFPFSDPIADGPVLQAAADRSLAHGTRWTDLLDAAEVAGSHVPVAVMTYANPVYQRGLDRAFRELRSAGASAIIVPDLSLEEARPWSRRARADGIAPVLLAAPACSEARVASIARASRGFLYMVGRYGTTGGTAPQTSPETVKLLRAAHAARPELPVLVGFGVRTPESVRSVLAAGADGVIVGSAIEEKLEAGESPEGIRAYVQELVSAGALAESP